MCRSCPYGKPYGKSGSRLDASGLHCWPAYCLSSVDDLDLADVPVAPLEAHLHGDPLARANVDGRDGSGRVGAGGDVDALDRGSDTAEVVEGVEHRDAARGVEAVDP